MGVCGCAEENSAGKDLSNQPARDAQQSTPANQTAQSTTSPVKPFVSLKHEPASPKAAAAAAAAKAKVAKQEAKAAKQEAAKQEAAKAKAAEQTAARELTPPAVLRLDAEDTRIPGGIDIVEEPFVLDQTAFTIEFIKNELPPAPPLW